MTTEYSWKNQLHDATLLELELSWKSGDASLKVRSVSKLITKIGLRSTTLVECPRRFPWGPSVSINQVRGPAPTEDGSLRLEIEMQTGDLLILEAAEFYAMGPNGLCE